MGKKLLGLLLALALLLSLLPPALAEDIPIVDPPAEENYIDPTDGSAYPLFLSASTEGILVGWENIPYATEYWLQRSVDGGDWVDLAVCAEPGFLDSAVQMGKLYGYRMCPVFSGNFGDYGEDFSEILFNPFDDVPSQGKTLGYVSWAFNNGVVTGTSLTGFSPDASCTRVQFVMMLWKLNGSPAAQGQNPFSDVSGTKTTKAILWALDAGIINSGRSFNPNGEITRVQIVMILWKMAGSPAAEGDNPFADVSGAKTTKAVLWAYRQGITKGTAADRFSPDSPCTRLQLVVFLYKYNDKFPVIGAPTLKLGTAAKNLILSWSAVKDATQYWLYIKKDEGGFGRIILDPTVTDYIYAGSYGHVYTVKVTPVFGRTPGESSKELSAALIKTPARPELRTAAQNGRELSLAWYTVSGATACEIYIRPLGTPDWTLIDTVDAADKSYIYRQLDPEQYYEVCLRGVNASDIGTAWGPMSLIESTEPITLSVRPGFFDEESVRRLTLEWNCPSDCGRFDVYAKEYYAGGDFQYLGSTEDTSFVYDAEKYSTRYLLRVVRSEEGALRRPTRQSAATPGDTGSFEQLNYERVLSLPSYTVSEFFMASRIDAISIVGDDLWYVKSSASVRTGPDDGYYPVVLFHVPAFRSEEAWRAAQNPELYVLHDADGNMYRAQHDSSLTWVPEEGCFYLVTCGGYFENGQDLRDCAVLRVSPQGEVLSAVPTEGYNVDLLSTLAYAGLDELGRPMFWSRDGKRLTDEGEYHKFSLGVMEEGVLKCRMTCISQDLFTMSNPDGPNQSPHCNDIHFENGKLYHTVFIYDDDGVEISRNWVYVLDMEHTVGVDNGMPVVPTLFVSQYDLYDFCSTETGFELEGIDVYRGEIYLGVNTSGMEDGLFRVKDYGDGTWN